MEVLYQVDLRGSDVLDETLAEMIVRADDPDVSAFASALVRGTLRERSDVDHIIREVAQNWDITRMTTIDRNILRLGAYELLHRDDIPPKVSINEAIELGKSYSTADSGTFINGILDRIKNSFGSPKEDDTPDGPTKHAADGTTS